LPCFEDKLSALQRAPLSQRLKQRELAIVEFRKGSAFGIAIKLLIIALVRHETCCVSAA